MKNNIKKITAVILSVLTIIMCSFGTFAVSVDDIKNRIEADYTSALNKAGKSSFHGFCNLATAYQLLIKGIYKDSLDYWGNGNEWYNHFKNTETTSGGYNVITVEGADCLYNLIKQYGNNLSNIVVSFGTGGSSGSNHCMLISNIIDGDVYFTDSFRYWIDAEGETRVLTLDEFMSEYKSMNGYPYGCIYFTKSEQPIAITTDITSDNETTEQNIQQVKTGTYEIVVDDLTFRKDSSSNSGVIDYFDSGTLVYITEVSNNWGKLTYNGKTGWICLYNNKTYAKQVSVNDVTQKLELKNITAYINSETGDLTAETTATGGWDELSYKYDIYKNGELLVEGEYSTDNKLLYTPEEDGTYSITVTVKDTKEITVSKTTDYIYRYTTETPLKGDVNGDGKISATDARIVLRYTAKIGQINNNYIYGADFNSDCKIGVDDARDILRSVAHIG